MPEKNPWPFVVLVGMILTALVVMSIFHTDTAVILNMVVLLGLGGGLGVLLGVKNNVNGNLSKLTDMIASAMDKLAAAQPPPPPPDKPEGGF